MRECLGKLSCTSSSFPIAILNCIYFSSDSATTTRAHFAIKLWNIDALVNLYFSKLTTASESRDFGGREAPYFVPTLLR